MSKSGQVVWLGNPLQPSELVEIAVKTGKEGNFSIATREGDQSIVEVELSTGGAH
jgi:hypothetical protein